METAEQILSHNSPPDDDVERTTRASRGMSGRRKRTRDGSSLLNAKPQDSLRISRGY
jgi:hypothetical protein